MTDTDDVVRSFYGRWASVYDRLAGAPPVATWRDRTAEDLGLSPGDTAVEMGCGTGANLPYLRERVGPGGRVVGLDLTRGMLRRARDRGREPGGLVQADATRPPLADAEGRDAGVADDESPDRGVDALLGTFVVGLFDDPGTVVDGWCDIVEPGGRVGLLHFHVSERPWAPPANAAYRVLVRLSSPDPVYAVGAAAAHDGRVRHARDALAARSTALEERTYLGGFLRLVVGRMPES